VVKIAMRGIGVNVGHETADSGEAWLIPRILGACPRAVCADVGANVGGYSRLLRRHGAARVLAFEPIPSTYSRLAEAMARFDGVTPVHLHLPDPLRRTGIHHADNPQSKAGAFGAQHRVLGERELRVVPAFTLPALVAAGKAAWLFYLSLSLAIRPSEVAVPPWLEDWLVEIEHTIVNRSRALRNSWGAGKARFPARQ
jgi:FkbM family methyltransferase